MDSLRYFLCLFLLISTLRYAVVALSPEAYEAMKEHYPRMMADWHNVTRYPPVKCSKEEEAFFKSCHNYKPPKNEDEDDDDYYEINEFGPQLKPKAVRPDGGCERIDFRTATADEWNRYRMALNATYNTLISNQSQYQLFASYHRSSDARGAHGGPGFLVWHREYLLRFEAALRMQDPTVCLMMADWTLDHPLSNPCDSVMFSDDFFGTSDGVLTGFWAHWRGYSPGCQRRIWRQCITGETGRGYIISDASLNGYLQNYGGYPSWCTPQNTDFEYGHGGCHVYVSGTMNDLACSVNDILFWSHHTAIDYYWQRARNTETNQFSKVSNYPTWWNVPQYHQATDLCMPFHDMGMVNRDGLRMDYDNRVSYRPARIPCSVDSQCNPTTNPMGVTGALWCFQGMCTSKIKVGGQCDNKPHNACYRETRCGSTPQCTGGRCVC